MRPTQRRRAAVAGVLALFALAAAIGQQAAVRKAVCAGSWYPADAGELNKQLDAFLAAVPPASAPAAPATAPGETEHAATQAVAVRPIALICPHAGYQYCGPVAGAAYARVRGQKYERVIVLAFSHRNAAAYRGVDVPTDLTAYATPLGNVPVDRAACDLLLTKGGRLFAAHPGVDAGEHSLELQLPYLQRVLGEFKLVPLLVGVLNEADCTAAAQALLPLIDAGTLLVASSDFTHFGANYGYVPFKDNFEPRLRELAEQAALPLLKADCDGFAAHLAQTRDTICGGLGPIPLLLRVLSMRGGAEATRAAVDSSGRQMGDWSNSVTYQSFVFTRRPGTLGSAERSELLRLARETVAATAKGTAPPKLELEKLPVGVRGQGACFVTLEKAGKELRGCIGNMIADGPLGESVVRNAVNAAAHDPRFPAVRPEEVDGLRIEISYLTPMRRIASPDEVIIGRHGLYIVAGWGRGVLLPQVAYERGWSRTEFLRQVCYKAGLPPDAWQQKSAELYTFEAEVFGEADK